MLANTDVMATIAVKDLEKARAFYGETLGLMHEGPAQTGVLTYRSGRSTLLVYVSTYAGTNEATAATWVADDVDGLVRALKAKGVSFQHYDDLPGTTREGDVHVSGKMRAAWFTDPDGNILALVSR